MEAKRNRVIVPLELLTQSNIVSTGFLLQKSLEDRIQELEIALEVVQKNELRDKQTIAKLQKQLARVSFRTKLLSNCVN
jgi:hypothetical protein